jgi:hypothetical protein
LAVREIWALICKCMRLLKQCVKCGGRSGARSKAARRREEQNLCPPYIRDGMANPKHQPQQRNPYTHNPFKRSKAATIVANATLSATHFARRTTSVPRSLAIRQTKQDIDSSVKATFRSLCHVPSRLRVMIGLSLCSLSCLTLSSSPLVLKNKYRLSDAQ